MAPVRTKTPLVSGSDAVALLRQEKAKRAAKKAPPKAPEAPKPDARTGRLSARGLTCLCGCGAKTTQNQARFLSGHDAKLRAEVIKAGLTRAALPEIVRPFFDEAPIAGLKLVGDVLVDVKGKRRSA